MTPRLPFVLVGATANEPDLLYATGFDAPDPVAALRRPDGSVLLLVGRMELGRARRGLRVECLLPVLRGLRVGFLLRALRGLRVRFLLRALRGLRVGFLLHVLRGL
ncbi:MAG: hypothetical protein II839_11020, partial [Kiritimatiellae bacterium]|nr:hypothetical protein [Kiritimatiellia bacterium]